MGSKTPIPSQKGNESATGSSNSEKIQKSKLEPVAFTQFLLSVVLRGVLSVIVQR